MAGIPLGSHPLDYLFGIGGADEFCIFFLFCRLSPLASFGGAMVRERIFSGSLCPSSGGGLREHSTCVASRCRM